VKGLTHKRKDLVVLTADSQQKQTIATLLRERWQSLGIRQLAIDIDADMFSHPAHDPGVYRDAGAFLSPFVQQYDYALVLIDAKWEGSPPSAIEIECKIQADLNRNGWEVMTMPQLDECQRAIIKDLNWAGEHSTELRQQFEDVWVAIVNKQVVAWGPNLAKVEKEAARKTGKHPSEIAVTFIEGGLIIYGTNTGMFQISAKMC
jgi:hypothetical protein